MQKKLLSIVFMLFVAGAVFAVNPNLSSDYVRMLARYATVDSADAAIYNPAGLTKLEDGLYIGASNQFIYKKYGFDEGAGYVYNSGDTQFSYIFPGASVSYKLNNWAVFLNFTVADGGGSLSYTWDVVPNVSVATLDANSQWFDITLGGSYAVNDMISLSLGGRLLLPSKTTDTSFSPQIPAFGLVDSSSDVSGIGFSGQFGMNITPIEKLNIGILYKSQAFWAEVDKAGGEPVFYAPNIISVGIGYDVIDNLNVQFGYKLGLESLTPEVLSGGTKYNNSMDFTLGAEYKVNSIIKPSIGVGYQLNRGTKDTNSTQEAQFNPDLNAFIVALGAVITPIKNLDISVGYMQPIYFTAEDAAGTSLKKQVSVLSLGVSYKFF